MEVGVCEDKARTDSLDTTYHILTTFSVRNDLIFLSCISLKYLQAQVSFILSGRETKTIKKYCHQILGYFWISVALVVLLLKVCIYLLALFDR